MMYAAVQIVNDASVIKGKGGEHDTT